MFLEPADSSSICDKWVNRITGHNWRDVEQSKGRKELLNPLWAHEPLCISLDSALWEPFRSCFIYCLNFFFKNLCMAICGWVQVLWAARAVGSSWNKSYRGYKPHILGTRNLTWILYMSTLCSDLVSPLSSPGVGASLRRHGGSQPGPLKIP